MLDSFASIISPAANLIATYLLHSSVLLILAFVVLRLSRVRSYGLAEHVWKAAAIAGLITTPLHLTSGLAKPIAELQFADSHTTNESSPTVEREAVPVGGPTFTPMVDSTPSDAMSYQLSGEHTSLVDVSDESLQTNDIDSVFIAPNELQLSDPELATEMVSHPTVELSEIPPEKFEPVEKISHVDIAATPPAIDRSADVSKASSSETTEAAPFAKPKPILNWSTWMIAASSLFAVLAVLIALGRLAVQTRSFRLRVSQLALIDDGPARRVLDELLQKSRVARPVQLLSSTTYAEPVAFGVWKWRIVLPLGIERELPRGELKALLAHELAHLVRGDAAWLWTGHLLCSLFAFQPLNFLARKNWRQAAEFQCDDWAVRQSVDPLSLARCLTRVAEWRRNHTQCAATLAVGGPKSPLSKRVERLCENPGQREHRDRWATGWRRLGLHFALLVVIGVLSLWGPRATLWAEPNELQPTDVSVAGNRLLSESDAAVPHSFDEMATHDDKVGDGHVELASQSLDEQWKLLRDELTLAVEEMQAVVRDSESKPELHETVAHLQSKIERLQQTILRLEEIGDFANANGAIDAGDNHLHERADRWAIRPKSERSDQTSPSPALHLPAQ